MEMLVGIPGTVGGALHGNTGAHGGDIGQWTASATVVTPSGETIERTRDDLFFGYRESNLDEGVVLEAMLGARRRRSPRARPADAKTMDHQAGEPADGPPVRRLHLQEPPRGQCGRADRQVRPEGDADRRRR